MTMNIATAFNQKYLKYAYVMLLSIYENQLPDDIVYVYVLHSDINREGMEQLTELTNSFNNRIEFIMIDPGLFPSQLKTSDAWSLEMYYRLLLPELLPNVDTILYLDVDIIVDKSLKTLFLQALNESFAYACPDVTTYPFSDNRDNIFTHRFDENNKYFCSGVMLINLKMMRERIKLDDFWKLAEKWNYSMVAPDQDLLNEIFFGKVKYLDTNNYCVFSKLAYNRGLRYDDIKQNATIIHFAGDKPWHGRYVHYDIERLWWDYAKKTPYYYEFLETFVDDCISSPIIYDAISNGISEKENLLAELNKAVNLIGRLSSMISK